MTIFELEKCRYADLYIQGLSTTYLVNRLYKEKKIDETTIFKSYFL